VHTSCGHGGEGRLINNKILMSDSYEYLKLPRCVSVYRMAPKRKAKTAEAGEEKKAAKTEAGSSAGGSASTSAASIIIEHW
jgi:hypothetical protein